jgi:hypothetical protein
MFEAVNEFNINGTLRYGESNKTVFVDLNFTGWSDDTMIEINDTIVAKIGQAEVISVNLDSYLSSIDALASTFTP